MSNLVQPHGSPELKQLLLEGDARRDELARAKSLPQVRMTTRETSDLIMLGIGAFTPLDGFMGKADWQGVCDDMKMASGLFWPIPITLSTSKDVADTIAEGSDVVLVDDEHGVEEPLVGLVDGLEGAGVGFAEELVGVPQKLGVDREGGAKGGLEPVPIHENRTAAEGQAGLYCGL